MYFSNLQETRGLDGGPVDFLRYRQKDFMFDCVITYPYKG